MTNILIIKTCEDHYNIFNDDKRSFKSEWILLNNKSYFQSIHNVIMYRKNSELASYISIVKNTIYESRGYVYGYCDPLNHLKKISACKRTIIDEYMCYYYSNVKLYTSILFNCWIFINR